MAMARRRGRARSSNTCAHCGRPSCRHCDVVCFDTGNAQAKPTVAVAPCIKTGNKSMYVVSPAVGVGRLQTKHVARLLGFPPHTDYTWHQLGNAVSVRAVAWIGESLANVSTSKFEADERDVPLDVWQQKNARRGRGGNKTTTPPWPRAAWCLKGGVRHASYACAEPVKNPLLPMIDVVRDGLDPVKTGAIFSYIHRLAARGMRYDDLLRVARPSGLVLPDGMDPDSLLAAGVPGVWRPDKTGRVVWAKTGAGAWWPAEIVVSVVCEDSEECWLTVADGAGRRKKKSIKRSSTTTTSLQSLSTKSGPVRPPPPSCATRRPPPGRHRLHRTAATVGHAKPSQTTTAAARGGVGRVDPHSRRGATHAPCRRHSSLSTCSKRRI